MWIYEWTAFTFGLVDVVESESRTQIGSQKIDIYLEITGSALPACGALTPESLLGVTVRNTETLVFTKPSLKNKPLFKSPLNVTFLLDSHQVGRGPAWSSSCHRSRPDRCTDNPPGCHYTGRSHMGRTPGTHQCCLGTEAPSTRSQYSRRGSHQPCLYICHRSCTVHSHSHQCRFHRARQRIQACKHNLHSENAQIY